MVVFFSNKVEKIVDVANEWITRVNDRLGVTPPANLYLESDFDEATSEMLLTVTIKFTTDVPGDTRLSIAITENDIVDAQETPAGVDSFYVHQHTLRDMITPPTGIPIDVSTPAGRVIIKQLRYSIPEHWDADHCEVVAFVHKNDGSKTVLQTAKAYVED